jgi:hypothetical protein
MESLNDVIDAVEGQRKSLAVFADDDAVAAELRSQFSTQNVSVTYEQISSGEASGFVIVRNQDGEFRGALGIDHFQSLCSPEIRPPWTPEDGESAYADIFAFLDDTVFTSYSRRQMLATSREIEERAWRVGDGTIYTGFQRSEAITPQISVYRRLVRRGSLGVRLFVEDEWAVDLGEATTLVSDSAEEIGAYWLVVFDGGRDETQKCGLVAEERTPGRYYGFWTYDGSIVDDIVAYLDEECQPKDYI